uniref:Uncharacterized protein n=1 Tax=Panagrolaimus sp. JU765 TaxID=591449 RepID=A0AC34QWC8_9BILA
MTTSNKTTVKKITPTPGGGATGGSGKSGRITKTNSVSKKQKQTKPKSARNPIKTPKKQNLKKESKGRSSSLRTDLKERKSETFKKTPLKLSTKSPSESNVTMSDVLSSRRSTTTSDQISMDTTQTITKIQQMTSPTTSGTSAVSVTGLPPSSITGISPSTVASATGEPYPTTLSNVSTTSTTDVSTTTASTMTSATNRPLTFRTVCDCGSDTFTKEQEKQLEESDLPLPDPDRPLLFVNKTIIQPLSYEAYKPMDLVSPLSTKNTSFRRAALLIPSKQDPINILTPFKPILHTLYYAHRHAFVIDDLIQNYQYLEDY